MNIQIQDKVLEFENNPEIIEQIFNSINEHLQKENLQFSYLNIDGEEVYDNFDSYIIENIESIRKVEVVAMTVVEMVNELFLSIEKYSKNAIPIITKLSEEFYQKPKESTWSQLTDLFEGIQWIIQSITQINTIESSSDIVSDFEVWNEYVQEMSKLNGIVSEFENAIVNNDNILLGDMLLYEIIPVFETMVKKLELLISGAVD